MGAIDNKTRIIQKEIPNMTLTDGSKRLCIFAFFDPDGIVDDYVLYLLEQMRAHCQRQLVVVNGSLTKEGESALRAHCDDILMRDNEGYDITAYKEGFLQQADIEQYDEVLFYNQSVFGPLCPLDAMFSHMGERDVDFWGLTGHKGAKSATWDNDQPIPPHVQSYFFAVRSSMFLSQDFARYWQNLPKIVDYWDAVSKHEVKFTAHFEKLGYIWATYLDTSQYETINDYHLMGMPVFTLTLGSPFCKRKSFITERNTYTSVPQGSAARELYDYITTKTDYPFEYIAKNLLRTCDISTVTKALNAVFSSKTKEVYVGKTAVVLWFSGAPSCDILTGAAALHAQNCTVYCLFSDESTQQSVSLKLPPNAKVQLIEGDGLTYTMGELWQELSTFTYLLYLNDALPLLLKEFFDATSLLTAIEGLSPSGCVDILSRHPHFGLLIPPMPIQQECLSLGCNFAQVREVIEQSLTTHGLKTPIDTESYSIATRGSMFFARTAVLKAMVGFDFGGELAKGLYPAGDYLPPIFAQASGYLTGFACTTEQAFLQMENRDAILRDFVTMWRTDNMMTVDKISFRMRGILDFYHERRHHMTLEQAFAAKLTFKQKLWIIAQLLLKPETFKRLRGNRQEAPPPPDPMA